MLAYSNGGRQQTCSTPAHGSCAASGMLRRWQRVVARVLAQVKWGCAAAASHACTDMHVHAWSGMRNAWYGSARAAAHRGSAGAGIQLGSAPGCELESARASPGWVCRQHPAHATSTDGNNQLQQARAVGRGSRYHMVMRAGQVVDGRGAGHKGWLTARAEAEACKALVSERERLARASRRYGIANCRIGTAAGGPSAALIVLDHLAAALDAPRIHWHGRWCTMRLSSARHDR